MDAAVGGLDAEIVTCIALPIKEHRTNAGSPGTEVVHREGGNEMLKGFQEQTFGKRTAVFVDAETHVVEEELPCS